MTETQTSQGSETTAPGVPGVPTPEPGDTDTVESTTEEPTESSDGTDSGLDVEVLEPIGREAGAGAIAAGIGAGLMLMPNVTVVSTALVSAAGIVTMADRWWIRATAPVFVGAAFAGLPMWARVVVPALAYTVATAVVHHRGLVKAEVL